MNNYKFRLLLIFCFCLSQVHAQIDSTTYLSEVEIIGQRIPERVSFKNTKIDKEQIDQYLSASLGELLTLNTPIFIKSYGAGGTATPSFRGTGASHTQVYWNGINLNSPMLGQVDLSLFPVAFTDEVTVNYGASSLLYGTGGLGGGIQMNSKLNWDKKQEVIFSQTYNTLQNSITNGSFSFSNEKWSSTTKLFYKDAQNLFDFKNPLQPGSPVWTNDHSGQIQYGALQEVGYKINDNHLLQGNLWYQNSERNLTPSMDNRYGDSQQGDESLRGLLSWKVNYEKLKIDWTHAFIHDYLWYQKLLNNDDPPKTTNSDSHSYQYQSHLRTSFQINDKLLLRGGYDYAWDNIHSNQYQASTDSSTIDVHQNTFDLYGGFDYFPTDQLSMSFLLRQQWIDGDTKPILPSIGLEYQWNQKGKYTYSLRGNISKNFHAPSLNDRYWYPVGNPDLLPEHGWTYEGTFGIQSQWKNNWRLTYDITAFSSIIHNWIVWKPAVSNLWRPENLKKVHSRGIEQVLQLTYHKNDWQLIGYASVSYVKSENLEAYDELDKSVGTQLIYTPIFSTQGYIQANYKSWYGIVEQQIYGKRLTQTDGSEYLPPYYLTNFSLGKQFSFRQHRFDLKARIENVFAFHYQSIARKPMPGRVYQLTLTYKL
ncbi:TonB-dependent receptor [Flammeovirga aprica]|uniref:TonB-dependent receptor plug domain-containing protein n=1 Tax=Flammeovirga aprica JL-4 TaxID=694437 RepID=A0A7X9P0R6_9BACT|nr:TonB-dependent receptor [Flammeovirga aprica]NME67446.1 TonB-dependent receptor plug domain-containing protein [Flammeovirga aprica JL-4]